MKRGLWKILYSCVLSLMFIVSLPVHAWSDTGDVLIGESETALLSGDEELLTDNVEVYSSSVDVVNGDADEIELYADADGGYEQEPNDTVSTANSIKVNAKYNGNISKSNDVDYYKFSLSNAGVVKFIFGHDFVDSSGNYWKLGVYNVDNLNDFLKEVHYAGNVYKDDTTYGLGLPTGDYIVKIESSYNYSNCQYHFNVNYEKSDFWEKESNNATNTSNKINVNTTYNGSLAYSNDTDNYTFSLNNSGVVSLVFGHDFVDSSSSYWKLSIYNSDNLNDSLKEIRYAGNVYNDVTSYGLGLPMGEYVIKVESSYNYSNCQYHFRVDYEKSDVWEKEFNDATNTATKINVNTVYNGSIAYSSDTDNYRFTLYNAGMVTFTFGHDFVDSSGNYWKYSIYNINNLNNPLKEIRFAGNIKENEESEGINLPTGDYIVRIESGYNYTDSHYHFSINDPNSVVTIIKGDVTGDGQVAMGDVVKLARAVAGNTILTDTEKDAGDVTGDGQIAMGDVVKLARFVAGTIKEL